ncbi:type I-E CRISPR-associated endoribonuclease Cas2 [Corynebacterium yudongzhengii]|uniref:Type I-E CRISPR-associated endoribonuclease Cas2 n=1 Tax=Corynebacterium yudongzhengii TaxID=2080740 RepID=A0A2U1T417_9CORY|nr:type I-E CRISPR-associated endoribonuclease Cas2e [Corynebacterium yudongzhengii]AWB82413.1 type I-E CRISPR-associated endoribonuclease Cas2 [Corynebacterium yudongzhengii]PWC00747.1 type I-E CRISPR-associated endoribonuclease Cas2 [Corynebacterium yudongzhengii]
MFLVITATRIPDHLHGYVSRFLTEVDTGVFVGNVSRRVRDNLWKRCTQAMQDGRLTMINNDPTREQGFAVNTLGPNRRKIVDFDGLLLPVSLSAVKHENDRIVD